MSEMSNANKITFISKADKLSLFSTSVDNLSQVGD